MTLCVSEAQEFDCFKYLVDVWATDHICPLTNSPKWVIAGIMSGYAFLGGKKCDRKLAQFEERNIFKYKMDCTSIECMTQVLVVSSAKEFRASERRWRNSCKGGKLFFSAPIFFFFQLSAEIP